MQPFDGSKFDKRFDDVLAPAITAADLEPYRVDRDPGVTIPIEDIQSGIESSPACLADITADNPNVWFELGYAIASRRVGCGTKVRRKTNSFWRVCSQTCFG